MTLFKDFITVVLPTDMRAAPDRIQFKYCNKQFKNSFDSNKKFRTHIMKTVSGMAKEVKKHHPEYEFNKKIFRDEVKRGHTPPGFVWHHDITAGILKLVKESDHRATPHVGGRALWGNGDYGRRYGKIGDVVFSLFE